MHGLLALYELQTTAKMPPTAYALSEATRRGTGVIATAHTQLP